MKRTKEGQVMAHCSTILNQVLLHLPKSEFERFVKSIGEITVCASCLAGSCLFVTSMLS